MHDEQRGNVWSLESLDALHRAIHRADDLEGALSQALEAVLEIFECDRVWLIDVRGGNWTPMMERTRPEYPGGLQLGVTRPSTPERTRVHERVFDADWCVQLDPAEVRAFTIEEGALPPRSILAIAIRPPGAVWLLGMHQCSHARSWRAEEERLFVEIGHRLADALASLLAHREVRESEQRLAQAQRVARLGYWERDVSTFEVKYSDEVYRIFGLSPSLRALEPAQLAERLHPDDRSIMTDAYEQAIAGGPRYSVDYRVLRPDGEVRYVHSEADITADADGRPLRMFGTLQDITDRKLTEERLVRYRDALAGLAREQAALRRVATLVARGEPPAMVFAAVAQEVAALQNADLAVVGRYDTDTAFVPVGAWSRADQPTVLGTPVALDATDILRHVFEIRGAARLEVGGGSGKSAAEPRESEMSQEVAAPITVAGELWGAIHLSARRGDAFPAGTEHRLADFTELVATAVANAQTQTELAASRARIVTTADQTRRRIERDLHDGAQQQLVSLGLLLRAARSSVPAELDQLAAELDRIVAELDRAQRELREFARGIHPAILNKGGLGRALRALASRSAVPVELTLEVDTRPPEAIEIAAYYVISEAHANALKHARATRVAIELRADDHLLRIRVEDDGVGGATFARGSGLLGLKDRVEALGGRITLRSAPGAGTSVSAELPWSAT